MKVCISISLLVILLMKAANLDAQEIVTPPLKPITAFNVGEILTYQIRYGIVVGGTTTLSLTEEMYKRKMVFHALAVGQTTGLANAIYGVKDIYESWFDKKTNLPYKQVRSIKEGSYTQYDEVTYNRAKNTVVSNLTGEHKVPEKILDLASTLYYIRRVDLSKVKRGNVIVMNMYFSDAIFPFQLKYRGKETIKTEFGRIRCHKISPVVEPGRIFKSKDDLTIWFTDDESCLPVLVRMDIRVVGNVLLKLVKYENTLNPLVIEK